VTDEGGNHSVGLDSVPSGRRAVVRGLEGGRAFTSRLAALGLVIGTPLRILENRGQGPVLALVRDTRVALGRREALKILVEEIPDERVE
jgi:ferrous iron transport protein A